MGQVDGTKAAKNQGDGLWLSPTERWSRYPQWLVRSLVLLLAVLLLLLGQPHAAGAAPSSERVLLTADLLQQRLQTPIQRDGKPTLDLRHLVIDLQSENADFRDRFYRSVQSRLQGGSAALGMDLSDSIVLGDWDWQRLGLRAPLYGDALFPLLTSTEQAQLKRDRRRLSQLSQLSRSLLIQAQPTALKIFIVRGAVKLVQTQFRGRVNATDVFFLGRVEAQGAVFDQEVNWSDTRFSQPVTFAEAVFQRESRFRNAIFSDRLRFNQAQFHAPVTFQGTEFQATTNFNQATFQHESNFSRTVWQGNADFAQATWQGSAIFIQSRFLQSLFLTDARFEVPLLLRQAQFKQPINLRSATILDQVDFGDARFAPGTYINVAGLEFNADQAEILGSPGQIGRVLSVPSLPGNETLLRNLVRNFRRLEQIVDANQVEYLTERLRLKDVQKRLLGVNVNTATPAQLLHLGFKPDQVEAIVTRRQQQSFLNTADLLSLEQVDLAAYVKVRDRIFTSDRLSPITGLQLATQWGVLTVLLTLSRYGTSFGLTIGVGLTAIALSSLMIWWVDRYRRRLPTPIVPPLSESLWMVSSFVVLMVIGMSAILRTADQPWLTLACVAGATLPIPLVLVGVLYRQGRYHDQLQVSYLVEDGSMRQLRLLIARLPVVPKFPFFRDRYTPILLDRRWNWLNYYDFSLNNWLKFGFNDIRLRDQDLPGLISALVWYQWGLGLLYVALLLWTLSRTIPGLNLLIYF